MALKVDESYSPHTKLVSVISRSEGRWRALVRVRPEVESEVEAGNVRFKLMEFVYVVGAALAPMEGGAWSVAVSCVCAEGQ